MKNKRIPTILGTILLLTILFLGVWLSAKTTNTLSKASGDCAPISVQTTNLTNKSADISFLTTSSCSSILNINNQTISNFKTKTTTHYYRIDGLSASTQYQYKLIIDGQELSLSDYKFQTAPLPSGNLSMSNLAWGKVILASGNPSPNSIVYLNVEGAWPLSALTDSNGQWHISLNNSFTEDKKSLFIPNSTGTEDIYVYSVDGQLTQVENDLSHNDPVPDIIVGLGFTPQLGTGAIVPTSVPISVPTSIIIDTKLPSFSASPSATIIPQVSPTIIPSLVPTIRTAKISTKSSIPVTGNTNPLYFLLLSSLLTLSFSLYFFNKR